MTTSVPEFGAVDPCATYVLRPGGYAVIGNAESEVAVLQTPSGIVLPGGGQNAGESAAAATVREVAEECGWTITLGSRIGMADELVFARDEQTHFRKRCTFFKAQIACSIGPGEADHRLQWLPPTVAAARLTFESQRWAVARSALAGTNR